MMDLKKSKPGSLMKLLSSCVSQMDLVLGEAIKPARVGHEFQADIPPLRAECNRLLLVDKSVGTDDEPNLHRMELPIPTMWTHMYVPHVYVDEIHVDPQAVEELETERSQLYAERFPLPGTSSNDWMPDECERILLGLYIFGKNFVLIERFLQTVKMGDILSFYYGKFYRSDKYRRWSRCWKSKSKSNKIVCGRRMFTGWRHQELLSRLLPPISADCQKILLETAWMFEQGGYLFEDYIFTLTTTFGLDKLVKAVGIGTGKQDLTRSALKPSEGNKTFSYHPLNPTGKPFSSLSSTETLQLLTGGFRLSKSQSSDLFWDAVWPRLHARDWNLKNQSLCGSKKNYAFLLPGVENFSRRVHVKGDHYFDSIDEVLHKIVLDPKILDQELEPVAENLENLQEHDMEVKLGRQDVDSFSRKKSGHYLQPPNVNNKMQVMISAVADAGFIHQGQPKMTVSLPREVKSDHSCCSDSGEGSDNTSKDVKNNVHTADVPKSYEDAYAKSSDSTASDGGSDKLDSSNGVTEHESKGAGEDCSFDNDQPDLAGEDHNCLDAVKESLDLNACVDEVLSKSSVILSDDGKLHNYESNWRSSSCDGCEDMVCEDIVSQLGPSKNIPSSGSLVVSNSDRSSQDTISDKRPDVDLYVENKPLMLFDLNLPYVPSDAEVEDIFSLDPVRNDEEQHVTMSLFTFDTRKQPEPQNIIDETCQGGDSMFFDNLSLSSEEEIEEPSRKDIVQSNDEQHVVDNGEQHFLDACFTSKPKKRSREQFRKDVLQNNDKPLVVDTFLLSKSKEQFKEIFLEDVVQESEKQNVVETALPSNPTESVPVDNSDGGSDTDQHSAMNKNSQSMPTHLLSLRALEAVECSPRKRWKGIGESENKSKKCSWQTNGSRVGNSSLNDDLLKPMSTEHFQIEEESSDLGQIKYNGRQVQWNSTVR